MYKCTIYSSFIYGGRKFQSPSPNRERAWAPEPEPIRDKYERDEKEKNSMKKEKNHTHTHTTNIKTNKWNGITHGWRCAMCVVSGWPAIGVGFSVTFVIFTLLFHHSPLKSLYCQWILHCIITFGIFGFCGLVFPASLGCSWMMVNRELACNKHDRQKAVISFFEAGVFG